MTLQQAIENLYAAFADLPKPQVIEACPCCMDEQEVLVLLQKPLRELSSEDLKPFAYSAPWTVGNWMDYCYFFPRMFELAVSFDGPYLADPEMLLSRLGDERQFSAHQLQAVNAMLSIWWREVLKLKPDEYSADQVETVLSAVALAGLPIEPLLTEWINDRGFNATIYLALFIRFNWIALRSGGTWSAFLEDEHSISPGATERKRQTSQLIQDWLLQLDNRQKLEKLKDHLEVTRSSDYLLETTVLAINYLQDGMP